MFQKSLKGNSFTTLSTYTKLLDEIRSHFAKALGKGKGYFSQRYKGACTKCGGSGAIEIGSFYEERLFDTWINAMAPDICRRLLLGRSIASIYTPESFKLKYAMLSQLDADGYDIWKYFSSVFYTGWNK